MAARVDDFGPLKWPEAENGVNLEYIQASEPFSWYLGIRTAKSLWDVRFATRVATGTKTLCHLPGEDTAGGKGL